MSDHLDPTTPCQHGDDAAAYTLGALDPHELDGFRRHLATCTICQAEVDSLEHMTSALGMAAPQHEVPRRLRRNVMNAVRDDAVERARTARRTSRLEATPSLSLRNPARAFAGGRARPGLVGLAAAVALVLVVVVVGLTAGGRHSGDSLAGTHVYQASVGTAEVVVNARGQGQLIVHKLNQLSPSQTYEVWFQHGAHGTVDPTPALFNVTASGDDAVNLPGSLAGVTKVMVTREPAGGKAKPTKPVLVAATIS